MFYRSRGVDTGVDEEPDADVTDTDAEDPERLCQEFGGMLGEAAPAGTLGATSR